MRLGNGNWMLWAGAAASAVVVVILLVVLLPQRGNGEPGPSGTPTATARPTSTSGPTLTAGPTSTSASTATARPTYTSGPTGTAASTSVPGTTSTPRPTAIPTGGDSYAVYFTEASYRVSGEGQQFYTTINITPVELFFGAQFVLEWDCTLFQIRDGWTRNNGHGRLYNGSEWVKATSVGLNPTGDQSPAVDTDCPVKKQGRVNFLVVWDNYYGIVANGKGVNVSREGTLVTVGWQTYSGADYSEGVTGIRFVPTCKIGGYLRGSYQYTRPVQWIDTTVEVN